MSGESDNSGMQLQQPDDDDGSGRSEESPNSNRFPVNSMRWTDNSGMTGLYTGFVNASSVPDGKGLMSYDQGPDVEGTWNNGEVEIPCRYIEDDVTDMQVTKDNMREQRRESEANALDPITEVQSMASGAMSHATSGDETRRRSNRALDGSARSGAENGEEQQEEEGWINPIDGSHANGSNQANDGSLRERNPFIDDERERDPSGDYYEDRRGTDMAVRNGSYNDEEQLPSNSNPWPEQIEREEFIRSVTQVEDRQYLFKQASALGLASSEREDVGDDYGEYGAQGGQQHDPFDAVETSYSSRNGFDPSYSSRNGFDPSYSSRNGGLITEKETPLSEDDSSRTTQMANQSQPQKSKRHFFGKRRGSNLYSFENLAGSDLDTHQKKKTRRRKWCIFLTIFTLLCLGAAGALLWYFLVHLTKEDEEVSSSENVNVQSQSTPKSEVPIKAEIPWNDDVPCANFVINVVTDRFGNETEWELFYSNVKGDVHDGELGNDLVFTERTKQPSISSEVERKRLRQHKTSITGRKRTRRRRMRRLNASLILRSSPYPYLEEDDPTYIETLSGQYTESICLPVGYYRFVIYDINGDGLCCMYGLGEYSLYFPGGGRAIQISDGIFLEEEVTEFQVLRDDIVGSRMESTSPSESPSSPPIVVSMYSSAAPTLESSVDSLNGTTVNFEPTQSPQPTSDSLSPPPTYDTLSPPPTYDMLSPPPTNDMLSSSPTYYDMELNSTASLLTSNTTNETAIDTVVSSNNTSSPTYSPSPTFVSNGTVSNTTTNITTPTFDNATEDDPSLPFISSISPTTFPTESPISPTAFSTGSPISPTDLPTGAPVSPTLMPSASPTQSPMSPSFRPSASILPSFMPSLSPTPYDPILDYTNSLVIEGVDGSSQFGFASAFAEVGNIMAVGAKDATNDSGVSTGAVYLYSLDAFRTVEGNDAVPEPFSTIYGQSAGDEFGIAVALSRNGKQLVVGARSENDLLGSVRMYQIIGENVVMRGYFSGQDPSGRSGRTVSISQDGRVVAVGATKGGEVGGGSVTTYRYEPPDWVPYGSVVTGNRPSDATGYSLALSYDGTTLVVGSHRARNNAAQKNSGRVSVYSIEGGSTEWTLKSEIKGEQSGNLHGSSIDVSPDSEVLVVGAMGANDQVGHCVIYEWDGSQYEMLHTIVGQTKREQLGSSAAVSNDGNIIACGGSTGRWNQNVGSASGLVRLYSRQKSQEKVIWPKGIAQETVDGASFGSTVALSADGDLLLVGASAWKGENNLSPGGVQIFDTDW